MAEIPVGELHTADRDAFFRDTNDELVYRRVRDSAAAQILQQILSALGGSANTTPYIYNISCPVSGTEYTQALPLNAKGFSIKARGSSRIEFAYSPLSSSFLTLPAGATFEDRNFYQSQSIYFRCSKSDEVVEIVAYA